MQKEMATIEQVAQDNHERARRLMKELNQMQHEYTELKKQVRAPGRPAGCWDVGAGALGGTLTPGGLRPHFSNSSLGGVFLCGNCEKLPVRMSAKSNWFFWS